MVGYSLSKSWEELFQMSSRGPLFQHSIWFIGCIRLPSHPIAFSLPCLLSLLTEMILTDTFSWRYLIVPAKYRLYVSEEGYLYRRYETMTSVKFNPYFQNCNFCQMWRNFTIIVVNLYMYFMGNFFSVSGYVYIEVTSIEKDMH